MNEHDDEIEPRLPDTLNEWQGKHATFFADTVEEIDIEGARMSGKTICCLDKEIYHLKHSPGIKSFMCRYSEKATSTKLKPKFEELCAIRGFTPTRFDSKEECYLFENDSKMYAFGLKAATASARYEKLRGLDVARVYNDQSEELPADIGQELRASLRQKRYRHQITFSPNPIPKKHWLAKQAHGGFPEDNSVEGRHYYSLEIYDNAYNLPPESIALMERTYPPDHAKHGAMILGKRGPNVIGDAVFEDKFKRITHVRPLSLNRDADLLQSFEFGKFNPCVVYGQRMYSGGLALLGGLIGEDMFLDEFMPMAQEYRTRWFGDHRGQVLTCCTAPSSTATTGLRFTSLQIMRAAKLSPRFQEGANAADVQLALLEQLAGYMRRRNPQGKESFAVNSDPERWIALYGDGPELDPFLAHAFEANCVWDEHYVSVGNNTVRQAHDDDWFANAVHAVQSMEVNFCGGRPTMEDIERTRAAERNLSEDGGGNFGGSGSWMSL